MKFIVAAGGQGTKVWPYSTAALPKQFRPILGETSLYQHNIDILLQEYSEKDIYVVTKKQYLEIAQKQSPKIPKENYIAEPDIRRDRGPAEGLAVYKLALQFPDEVFMIVQSDCVREPSDKYLVLVKEMIRVAEETGKLVTGGIKPQTPITGIDYLQLGKKMDSKSGLHIHEIDKFLYRPQTVAEIEHLIHGERVITHSNHMTWHPAAFKAAYKKYRPDWHEALETICESIGTDDEERVTNEIYESMEKGATEQVTQFVMDSGEAVSVTLPYHWSDIGSWSSLQDYFAGKGQNYIDAQALVLDSQNVIIKADKKKAVVVMGMKNTVVIDTEDALLVMDRDKCGDVGSILDELKNRGMERYL